MLRSKIQYVTQAKRGSRKEEDWPKNWKAKTAKAAEWGDNRLKKSEGRWAFKQLWWVPIQDGTHF